MLTNTATKVKKHDRALINGGKLYANKTGELIVSAEQV